VQCVEREGAEQGDAGGEGRDDYDVVEASPEADLGDRVEDRGEGGREQDQAGDVEVRSLSRGTGFEAAPRQDEAGQGERHVDQEDPPPRQVADDQAADDWSRDWPEQRGGTDQRHHPSELASAGRLDQ